MATRVELINYASNLQDPEAPDSPQTVVYEGRCYAHLSKGKEVVSDCFKSAKRCAGKLYGPPYPPLSMRKVVENYCEASFGLVFFGVFGGFAGVGIILEATTNPSPESLLSPAEAIAVLSFVEGASLGAAAWGLKILHKTCHAPRLDERQALLPPS